MGRFLSEKNLLGLILHEAFVLSFKWILLIIVIEIWIYVFARVVAEFIKENGKVLIIVFVTEVFAVASTIDWLEVSFQWGLERELGWIKVARHLDWSFKCLQWGLDGLSICDLLENLQSLGARFSWHFIILLEVAQVLLSVEHDVVVVIVDLYLL